MGSLRQFHRPRPGLPVKKLLINLFDVQGIFDPAPDIVADHQSCELIAIYQDNSLTQQLRAVSLAELASGRGA